MAQLKSGSTVGGKEIATTDQLDGIVESGSNANGNYVKYVDGTMICYKTVTFSETLGVEDGALFRSPTKDLGDYAAVFSSTPKTYFEVEDAGDGFTWVGYFTGYPPSPTSFGRRVLFTPVPISYTYFSISCMAIGKWK